MSCNWVEATDPSSGRKYYANVVTRETVWNPPEEWLNAHPESRPKVVEKTEKKSLWQSSVDPKTGRTFYYNVETRETRWDNPDRPDEIPPVVQQSQVKEPPKRTIVTVTPAQTVASVSKHATDSLDSKKSDHAHSSQKSQGSWEESVDQETGKKYYFHTVTRETRWTKPVETIPEKNEKEEIISFLEPVPMHKLQIKSDDDDIGDDDDSKETEEQRKTIMNSLHTPASRARMNSITRTFSNQDTQGTAETDADAWVESNLSGNMDVPDSNDELLPVQWVNVGNKPLLSKQIGNLTESYKLINYAKNNYSLHKDGFFSKKSLEDMLLWTDKMEEPILKKLSKVFAKEATQAFRNISGFMGDRKSGKPANAHVFKLLQNAIAATEDFRDEVYAQLCRQVSNNPSKDNTIKGWKLFAICTGVFPPSEEFACYLSAFFTKAKNDYPNSPIAEYAEYSIKRLDRTIVCSARQKPPIAMEIDAVQEMRPITIRVRFLDDTFKTLSIDSQTNARDVCDMLSKKLSISNDRSFALTEIMEENNIHTVRYLEDDFRILDVMAYWEDTLKGVKQEASTVTFKIVYQVRLFIARETQRMSRDMLHMYFVQAWYNIVMRNYPCSEKEALTFAAYIVQATYGDNDSGYFSPGFLGSSLSRFISADLVAHRDAAYLEARILQEHTSIVGISTVEAKRRFLEIVRKMPIYGATFFKAVQVSRVSKSAPEDVYVAVNEWGLFVCDSKTREIKKSFELTEILTYGYKENNFLMVAGNLAKQRKLNFHTLHGKEINDLIVTYINLKVAAK